MASQKIKNFFEIKNSNPHLTLWEKQKHLLVAPVIALIPPASDAHWLSVISLTKHHLKNLVEFLCLFLTKQNETIFFSKMNQLLVKGLFFSITGFESLTLSSGFSRSTNHYIRTLLFQNARSKTLLVNKHSCIDPLFIRQINFQRFDASRKM